MIESGQPTKRDATLWTGQTGNTSLEGESADSKLKMLFQGKSLERLIAKLSKDK